MENVYLVSEKFYKGSSVKSSQIGEKYRPVILEHQIIITNNDHGFTIKLPGSLAFVEMDQNSALDYAKKILIDEHWVLNKDIALKRAEKEVELRTRKINGVTCE